jgi:hypothetical protein
MGAFHTSIESEPESPFRIDKHRLQPEVLPPGLPAMSRPPAPHRLGRGRGHDLLADEVPCQFGAVPPASERPDGSGSSQPRRTRSRATSGKRPGPTRSRTIRQGRTATNTIAVGPCPGDVPIDADLPGNPIQLHRHRRPSRQRFERRPDLAGHLSHSATARPRHYATPSLEIS